MGAWDRQTQELDPPTLTRPQLKLPKWPRGWVFGCWAVLFLLDPSTGGTQTGLHFSITHAHAPTLFFFPVPLSELCSRRGNSPPLHCLIALSSPSRLKFEVLQPRQLQDSQFQHASDNNKEPFAYRRSETRARSGLLILPKLESHRTARRLPRTATTATQPSLSALHSEPALPASKPFSARGKHTRTLHYYSGVPISARQTPPRPSLTGVPARLPA